jgi:hypothetical protein
MIRVRPYDPSDRDFVLSLASRFTIGIPSWRDPDLMTTTAQQWITTSIEQQAGKTTVFVAENEQGERLGFASVSHSKHFTQGGPSLPRRVGNQRTSRGTRSGHSLGPVLRAMGTRPGVSCPLLDDLCRERASAPLLSLFGLW